MFLSEALGGGMKNLLVKVGKIALILMQIWLFGSFSYLDVNKAAKLLSSMGFIITDPSGKLTGENDD